MGHHQFDTTSKSKPPGTETDIAVQVERMNLNGLRRVTQEHQQLLEQTRHHLRDHISSRMGELLLLGHTMLNEYCELCAGILMEDRQGVRCCVACDLVNTELAGGQNNRTTVSNNDDQNDFTDIATERSNMSQSSSNEVFQPPAQFPSTDSPFHSPVERSFSMRTVRSERLTVDVGTSPHADLLGSGNVQVAIQAVDDKLKWCAERLKSCENVEEVMKLYEAIDCGIEILKHFIGASH